MKHILGMNFPDDTVDYIAMMTDIDLDETEVTEDVE